jgi:hypothetical protein
MFSHFVLASITVGRVLNKSLREARRAPFLTIVVNGWVGGGTTCAVESAGMDVHARTGSGGNVGGDTGTVGDVKWRVEWSSKGDASGQWAVGKVGTVGVEESCEDCSLASAVDYLSAGETLCVGEMDGPCRWWRCSLEWPGGREGEKEGSGRYVRRGEAMRLGGTGLIWERRRL